MKSDQQEKDFFASESEPLARESHPAIKDGSDRDEVLLITAGPGDDDEVDDDDDERFDWIDSEDIVVHEQSALAVYENKFGGIVIRRQMGEFEPDDTVIVLASPGAAYRLIEAIQKQLDLQKKRRAAA